MTNLINFLKSNSIDALGLPSSVEEQLRDGGIVSLMDLFSSIQMHKFGQSPQLKDWNVDEVNNLNAALGTFLQKNGIGKGKKESTEKHTQQPTGANKPDPDHVASKNLPGNRYIQILGRELLDQEAAYQEKLRKVDLIGEVPISAEELHNLSEHFKRIFYKHPSTVALDTIERGAPACFVIFLVGQGVYGYKGGDYWSSVSEAINQNADSRFGQVFERIIHKYRLAAFTELQSKSTRYVSLILAHGGIPVYSLDDYFSNIVLASIIRSQYSELDGDELIDSLLSSSVVNFTDKPVTHFLEFGGKVARDIFNRSRRLVLHWQSTQVVPDPDSIGLPQHMISHFSDWVSRQGTVVSSTRNSRNRLKKPEICLDPWGVGVFLKLPVQTISVFSASDCRWEITAGNHRQTVPVSVDSNGRTEEITLRLDTVAEYYKVVFSQDDKPFEWEYKVPSSIFVFDSEKGLFQNRPLDRETWLLYPRHLEVKILDGDGDVTEDLPALPGNWYPLKAEGWDLSHAKKIAFVEQGDIRKEIDVKTHESVLSPSLVQGRSLTTNLEQSDLCPVYIGKPPAIHIPVSSEGDVNAALTRWRIHIRSSGYSDPCKDELLLLSELPEAAITVATDGIFVLLEHPALLNTRPMGTFQISLIGPLGQDTTFTISILLECDIRGLERLYLPNRNGAQSVELGVNLGLLDSLVNQDPSTKIDIRSTKPGAFIVTVPPEVSRIKLQVMREYHDGDIVIPLELRVRRLRWRLVTQELLENWSDDLLDVSISSFVEKTIPLLIVSLPGVDSNSINVALRLLDTNANEVLLLKPARRSRKHQSDYWRFELDSVQSNLQETSAPILRLELIVEGLEEKEMLELPVVSFTRSIDIRNLCLSVKANETQFTFDLNWYEPLPLQNRTIFLWSLWRPWQPPISVPVPDDAIGKYEFVLDADALVGGYYRLGFAVVDPWVNAGAPEMPAEKTLGTIDFEILSQPRYLQLLNTSHSYDEHLELLLVSEIQSEDEIVSRELRWCLKNLHLASSQQIFILKNYLDESQKDSSLKGFGENLFIPDILARLIEDTKTGDLPRTEVSSLLQYAPPVSTWTETVCELLFDFDDRRWQMEAFRGLLVKKPYKALSAALDLIKRSSISVEDSVELLYENKHNVISLLKYDFSNHSAAKKILELLEVYNPFSGLPVVRPGTWVRSNAGWGRIETIQEISSHVSIDQFMENQGNYRMIIRLHIELDPKFEGERAVINMQERTISFQRAKSTYVCEHCKEFISTNRDIYRSHVAITHPDKYVSPPTSETTFACTFLEFNHSRNK